MRGPLITVALSLVVHSAALLWFVSGDNSEGARPGAGTVLTEATPAPVETPALEVALLDDSTATQFPASAVGELVPRPAAGREPRGGHRADQLPAIAAATTATTEIPRPTVEPPTEPPAAPPSKRSLLSMRDGHPEPMIHRPGSDGISDEALKQMVDGKIPVKIANLPGAKENADFDRAQARLGNSKWVENATPDELTAARFDREAARQAKKEVELVRQKDGTYQTEKKTFSARTERDGTVTITDKKNWQQKSLFHAEFDVTDAFMRRHGQDPYASEKLKFLDRTRDQRVELGKRYRSEQLWQSAQLMAVNLGRLWGMTQDPVTRKDELFALWDECAETGDDELVAGGAAARRLLLNWIHVKHVEFTAAELAAFNARRQSTASFAP